VHRVREDVEEVAWIGAERKAERRRTTGRNPRSSTAALGVEARQILDVILDAVH
jgi:hypothetical protein